MAHHGGALCTDGPVPGDGTDCELGWGLVLVHQQLQVHAALVPSDGHHWIPLALVTVVEQPGNESAASGGASVAGSPPKSKRQHEEQLRPERARGGPDLPTVAAATCRTRGSSSPSRYRTTSFSTLSCNFSSCSTDRGQRLKGLYSTLCTWGT